MFHLTSSTNSLGGELLLRVTILSTPSDVKSQDADWTVTLQSHGAARDPAIKSSKEKRRGQRGELSFIVVAVRLAIPTETEHVTTRHTKMGRK